MAMMAVCLLIGFLVVFLIKVYNDLVRLKNQITNGFAQIDVQLKRRYDLIPNLMEVAKRYMGHEADTLQAVTEARNLAQGVRHYPENGEAMAAAEGRLSRALAQFYAVAENYPDLKADALMKQTMDELTNTENRIGFARQHYNDSVMFYNNEREVFPNNLISGFFGFERLSQLEFEDKALIDVAPKATF